MCVCVCVCVCVSVYVRLKLLAFYMYVLKSPAIRLFVFNLLRAFVSILSSFSALQYSDVASVNTRCQVSG